MRLADFIGADSERILAEWESFARSIWPNGAPADPTELRDSAAEILRAIVADMGTAQSNSEQSEKSMGRGVGGKESDRLDHASQLHGVARVGSGMALVAVVSEYRALRASVLRLWRKSKPDPDVRDLDDLTRFNEAIDQSLALAVQSFTARIDNSRKMFLGILGHDLRNPLSAINLTAKVAKSALPDTTELPGQLSQIMSSAQALGDLIADLIDFTSSTLGVGLPLAPADANLHAICEEVAREMRAAHPRCTIRVSVKGDLCGVWDAHRLRQLLANLLGNAIQHGSPTDPVYLMADGSDRREIVVSIHNSGDPIPDDVLPTIFDPLVRPPRSAQHPHMAGSIGLGLYIVREIATAHGGTAQITSSAARGTTATVRLPRRPRKQVQRLFEVREAPATGAVAIRRIHMPP